MDKLDIAVMRMQEASKMSFQIYNKPLVITYSGGKDSEVLLDIAKKSGIEFEVIHNHTTVDAPETFYHTKRRFKELELAGVKCKTSKPVYKGELTSMWKLIQQKGIPPTRNVRYCCAVLKENGAKNGFIATGVRWGESKKRAEKRGIYEKGQTILNNDNDDKRKLFEHCTIKSTHVCNPIIDWEDSDIWNYIASEKLDINELYKCGFNRVGCVGCPLARRNIRQLEFMRYPRYKKLYILAFDKMIEKRKAEGKMDDEWRSGKTGREIFNWWMEDRNIEGQFRLDGFEDEED